MVWEVGSQALYLLVIFPLFILGDFFFFVVYYMLPYAQHVELHKLFLHELVEFRELLFDDFPSGVPDHVADAVLMSMINDL